MGHPVGSFSWEEKMKPKSKGIFFTVMEREKKTIQKNAATCGINITEYLRQRALGYAPQAVPPDVFFHFCEKIDALMEPPFSPEVNERAMALLSEIENALLTPHKEGDQPWLPPDSGLSKTG